MLHRESHYWLCCTKFNAQEVIAELGDVPVRVTKATRPTNKFGPYDYIFIDASNRDQPICLLLQSLFDRLEPHAKTLAKWGDNLTHGVTVTVRTSERTYSEAVEPDTLRRAALMNLQISFAYEYV